MALGGIVNSGDEVENRCFTGAVGTDEPVNLARSDFKIILVHRPQATKKVGHIFNP
jgi:hypothetical protein